MKNIVDVLRNKEQELLKIQSEVDALRVAARLVAEDGDNVSVEGDNHILASTGTSEARVKEISAGGRRQFP